MRFGRYHTALIGATLAMSLHVYLSYGGAPFFAPARVFSSIGSGLMFGHVIAWVPVTPMRLIQRRGATFRLWGGLLAIILALIAYWTHHGLFLANTSLNVLTLLPIALATTSGTLILIVRPKTTAVVRFLITAVAIGLILWLSTRTSLIPRQLYFRHGIEWYTLMTIGAFSVSLSAGLHGFTRR